MLRSIPVLFAALLATANCAPTSTYPQSDVVVKLKARNSINDCGDSTFINRSSGGSPKVADCRQLAANISGGGTWTTTFSISRQLAQYGTCAFNVWSTGSAEGASSFNVGNQDIIDVINDSIAKFQWNGLVGADGVMGCQTYYLNDNAQVQWSIYHT